MEASTFDSIRQIFSSIYQLFKWTIPGTNLTPMFIITAPWIVAASIRVFKSITGNTYTEDTSYKGR